MRTLVMGIFFFINIFMICGTISSIDNCMLAPDVPVLIKSIEWILRESPEGIPLYGEDSPVRELERIIIKDHLSRIPKSNCHRLFSLQ